MLLLVLTIVQGTGGDLYVILLFEGRGGGGRFVPPSNKRMTKKNRCQCRGIHSHCAAMEISSWIGLSPSLQVCCSVASLLLLLQMMMLLLLGFMRYLQAWAYSCVMLSISWSSEGDVLTSATSSARTITPAWWVSRWQPRFSFRSLMSPSMKILYRRGERTPPCLTPCRMGMDSLTFPSQNTWLSRFSYKDLSRELCAGSMLVLSIL